MTRSFIPGVSGLLAGWRPLAPFAALFIMLILFAVGGMFAVAYEADRIDAARAREAVGRTFSGMLSRLESAAEMNAATPPIAGALSGPDATPAAAYGYFNFTNSEAFGYHGTIVLNSDGSAFAGTRAGLPWTGPSLARSAQLVAPVAARLSRHGTGTVHALVRDAQGHAIAVAVANILPVVVPGLREGAVVDAREQPRRLAMLAPVDEQFVPKMLPSLGVKNFRAASTSRNDNSAVISVDNGAPIVFVWRPRTPGRASIARWAPAIGTLLVLALVMLVLAARANLAATQALQRLANHDPLTKLANRAAFKTELKRRQARGDVVALGIIDLNDFKQVNDRHGHPAGDSLLFAVAAELALSASDGDFVARLGGDEFAWISPSLAAANRLSDDFAHRIYRPFHIGPLRLKIGAAIGVALAQPGMTASALVALADARLYERKHALKPPQRRRIGATRPDGKRTPGRKHPVL